MDKHVSIISAALNISARQVENTIDLLAGGATIPFISRYRKEATGSLDEQQVEAIEQWKHKLVKMDTLRSSILDSIEEQGKLTPELKEKIEQAQTFSELEDLYLPYRPKRKTRATVAKEKGLEPLAEFIMAQGKTDPKEKAEEFINEQVKDVEEALQGARDIIAEWINENQDARNKIRFIFSKTAFIYSKLVKGKEEEGIKYKDYFDFSERLSKCPSHRFLAMFRGEEEGFLRVSILPEYDEAIAELDKLFLKGKGPCAEEIEVAIEDSYERLLESSIETEFRNSAKEAADEEAIKVFAENLRQLLLAAPLGQKRVLALDPGFRTGCKTVCLDEQGALLHNETIYPHAPQYEERAAAAKIRTLVSQYKIESIAIGNGTASRETEAFIRKIPFDKEIQVFVVNESGASIYSASAVAREEFPDYDVTVRGAVSIGRRLMDPLAELVKIDAKSIGVGQYQHDVDQQKLKEGLDRVVESCVNMVGVNLNTASKHLLTYVSGLGSALAQNIVDYRSKNGLFKSRSELRKVARLGDKAFEQCAGFLRIPGGEHPLDNSAVHPENYKLVESIAKDRKCEIHDLMKDAALRSGIDLKKYISNTVGLPTLNDILQELAKPGRDPRQKIKVFEFAKDVRSMDDLREGMVIPGIVTNITNFGAFVDIGVKQDGLVHISHLANRFVSNPNDVVQLNQHVQVKVLEVDVQRKRIQLSMKEAG